MNALCLASLLVLSLGGSPAPSDHASPPAAMRACREHPSVRPPCFAVRGRLRNRGVGPPVYVIWVIGSKRLLGVSESMALPDFERMPENVSTLARFGTDVFGDFEFCPFTRERPGIMRLGCIQSGRHLRTKPAPGFDEP